MVIRKKGWNVSLRRPYLPMPHQIWTSQCNWIRWFVNTLEILTRYVYAYRIAPSGKWIYSYLFLFAFCNSSDRRLQRNQAFHVQHRFVVQNDCDQFKFFINQSVSTNLVWFAFIAKYREFVVINVSSREEPQDSNDFMHLKKCNKTIIMCCSQPARRREFHRKCHVDDLLTWNACTSLRICNSMWCFMKIIAINNEINVFLFTYLRIESTQNSTAIHLHFMHSIKYWTIQIQLTQAYPLQFLLRLNRIDSHWCLL